MIYPLSGRGQEISWDAIPKGKRVLWGNTKFDLLDKVIKDILNNYFTSNNKWYPLGASMTKPIRGGLGYYIQTKYSYFTSRHASAIASIMVHDNFIEFKKKRPILLRKVA